MWLATGVLIFALRPFHEVYPANDDRLRELREAGARGRLQDKSLAARQRARELLRKHLNEDQREELDTVGAFMVVARSGRRYRISAATTFNVDDELGNDYCIQFRTDRQCRGVPLEDLMLAQKLLLECDEAQFLRLANKRSTNSPFG